jgi:HAD superfamily hydrolase (TIGR01450 family)
MSFQPSKRAQSRQRADGARAALVRARAYVLDVDGCLALGARPGGEQGVALPGARELLVELKRRGARFVCLTNASGLPPESYAAQLRGLGLEVGDDELITPAVIAAAHLARERPAASAMVLGGDGLLEPLRRAGVPTVAPVPGARAAVVLVGAPETVSALELRSAAEAIRAGAELLVTSYVPAIPTREGLRASMSAALGAGLAHVTSAEPRVVGKPSALAARHVAERLGARPRDLVVVGDDPALDVALGRRMGATTVLVLSGAARSEDTALLPVDQRPDLVLRDVAELLALL